MAFAAVERLIAFRYLRARREEGFISVIAAFSLIGITLGVGTLIVVMAVMNGFRVEMLRQMTGISGQLGIQGSRDGLAAPPEMLARIRAVPGVLTATPAAEGQVMAVAGDRVRGVVLRGIQPDDLRARLPLAAAIATGRLPRVLRGQFELARVLRDVPDSAETFIGLAIPFDPIAGTLAGDEDPYRALGSAQVRNVVLPARTSHIGAPRADHLAFDPATRAWIERYRPDAGVPLPEAHDVANLPMAAELWFAIKRAWCGEAQAAARAGKGS